MFDSLSTESCCGYNNNDGVVRAYSPPSHRPAFTLMTPVEDPPGAQAMAVGKIQFDFPVFPQPSSFHQTLTLQQPRLPAYTSDRGLYEPGISTRPVSSSEDRPPLPFDGFTREVNNYLAYLESQVRSIVT